MSANTVFWMSVCLFLLGVVDGNLRIFSIENCEQPPEGYSVNVTNHFYRINGDQYMSGDMILGEPIGDDCMGYISIEVPKGDDWKELFHFRERICAVIKHYLGKMAHDFELNAQIPPESCPFPKGKYHIQNFKLNFNDMPFNTFPLGKMRFTVNVHKIATNKLIACIIINSEFSNTDFE